MAAPYSVPTIEASGTIQITDVHSAPTSSWPYDSMGPVMFRNLNFVNTCEEDYYYSATEPNGAVPLLVSKVSQCYDPATAFQYTLLLLLLFLAATGFWAWFFAKKQHKP